MITFTILLADKKISITSQFETTKQFCKDYLCDEEADFSVEVSMDDIAYERGKSEQEDKLEGIPVRQFSDQYLETLAVYRKIANHFVQYNTILFHGSVIAVDGKGYLFTAKSGTGKSTHTRLWREVMGERAFMVNDDKPLLRIADDKVYAYGTPWDGKHHLSTNCSIPLAGICILERGETNKIVSITAKDALPMLFQQSHRPSDQVGMIQYLNLMEQLSNKCYFYRLNCNMDREAAIVSYEGMRKEDM